MELKDRNQQDVCKVNLENYFVNVEIKKDRDIIFLLQEQREEDNRMKCTWLMEENGPFNSVSVFFFPDRVSSLTQHISQPPKLTFPFLMLTGRQVFVFH